MNTPHDDETKLRISAKLCETRRRSPANRQIIIRLFGKRAKDLTVDEYARYRRLTHLVSYYRRHDQNKAQQRKEKSWKKLEILKVLGWAAACDECGYDKYIGALEFHHLDPGLKTGLVTTVAEARKCRLLCSNCHREIQAGMPSGRGGRPVGPLDPLLIPYMRLSGLTEAQIAAAMQGRPDADGLTAASKVIHLGQDWVTRVTQSDGPDLSAPCDHEWVTHMIEMPQGYSKPGHTDCARCRQPKYATPATTLTTTQPHGAVWLSANQQPTMDAVGVEPKPMTPGKTSTWLVNR